MRVLIFHNILWSYYKGAIFSELYKLAQARGDRYEFVQIASTSSERVGLAQVDLTYHQYPYTLLFEGAYQAPGKLRRAAKLLGAIAGSKADVVVLPGYDDPAMWVLWLYCVLTRKKKALALDSTRFDRPRRWWKELIKHCFVSRCQGALCYGTRSAEYAVDLGMPSDRVFPGCQAVPVDRLLATWQTQNEQRNIRPIEDGQTYFLYVGRLAPEKDLETLIRAFARLHARRPQLKLCLVGEGPLKNDLLALVRELHLQETVLFAGGRPPDQLLAFYRGAQALVLPSVSEPWGLVVNEAFAMQCPAIVSDRCGCVPDLILEGKTGYQFRTGDEGALLDALDKMAAAEPSQRASMGEQCLELIRKHTPEAAARQMLAGIELIHGQGRG